MALSPRDCMIVDLRTKGHTYDSIADNLFKAGFTTHTISRVRVQTLIRRVAPHLLGNIKRKLRLPTLIHKAKEPLLEDYLD